MALDTRGYRLSRPLRALVLATMIATLGLPTETASATYRPALPFVVPPVGKIYDHLSVAWWKYALEQPNSENPLLDETGKHCQDAQAGPVFFLVGTAGTGEATHDECVVPIGKLLYFPLVNAFDVHTPGDGLDTPDLVWEDLHTTLGFRVDSMYATVDGKPVQDLDPATSPYRGCAGPVRGCRGPSHSTSLQRTSSASPQAPTRQLWPMASTSCYHHSPPGHTPSRSEAPGTLAARSR